MTERREKPLIGDEGDEEEAARVEAPDDEAVDEVAVDEEVPFEEALEELEAIVHELEEGELGLEAAMERFERGLVLVKACRSKLKQVELKVEELIDGEPAEMGE